MFACYEYQSVMAYTIRARRMALTLMFNGHANAPNSRQHTARLQSALQSAPTDCVLCQRCNGVWTAGYAQVSTGEPLVGEKHRPSVDRDSAVRSNRETSGGRAGATCCLLVVCLLLAGWCCATRSFIHTFGNKLSLWMKRQPARQMIIGGTGGDLLGRLPQLHRWQARPAKQSPVNGPVDWPISLVLSLGRSLMAAIFTSE